jgi:hypothetical protein
VDAIAASAPDLPVGLSALPPDLVQAVVDRLAEIGASMSEDVKLVFSFSFDSGRASSPPPSSSSGRLVREGFVSPLSQN